MEWSDTGIILSARRHGETSAIVHLITNSYGRYAGLVRGGAGRKSRSIVQPGNEVSVTWRARLSEHLGFFTLELVRPRAARILHDPIRLSALTSATEILDAALPEREPYNRTYANLCQMLDSIDNNNPEWLVDYVQWEFMLLSELGFAPDISLIDESAEDWAISIHSGGIVRPKNDGSTLNLPRVLVGKDLSDEVSVRRKELIDAFKLTGNFLGRAVPDSRILSARNRLLSRILPKEIESEKLVVSND